MSGQDTTVIIEATPDMDTYAVGDNLTLNCTADPLPTDTSITVTYLWECSGCFANGLTTPTINRILTVMDNSTISCTVNVSGNVTMTDMPFDLQITQGIVIDNLTVKLKGVVRSLMKPFQYTTMSRACPSHCVVNKHYPVVLTLFHDYSR